MRAGSVWYEKTLIYLPFCPLAVAENLFRYWLLLVYVLQDGRLLAHPGSLTLWGYFNLKPELPETQPVPSSGLKAAGRSLGLGQWSLPQGCLTQSLTLIYDLRA